MNRIGLTALVALLTIPSVPLAAEGFKIIAHQDVTVDSMSKADLARMFTKKVTSWHDGKKVKPVDQPSRSAARSAFTRAVHGKSVAAIRSYWQQRIFSGRGVPPPERLSDAQVLSYVMSQPGAVGYVSSNVDIGGAKVLKLTEVPGIRTHFGPGGRSE